MITQVITVGQKQHVLEGCRSSGLGGGHFGTDETLAKVSERYFWRRMDDDVRDFAGRDECQKAKRCDSREKLIMPISYG